MNAFIAPPSLNTFHMKDVRAYYICRDDPHRKDETTRELIRVGIPESQMTHIPVVLATDLSASEKEYWLNPANFYSVSRDTATILDRACTYLTHLTAIRTILEHAEANSTSHPFLIVEEGVKFLWDDAHGSVSPELPIPPRATIYYLGGIYEYSKNSTGGKDYTFENIRYKLFYDPYIQVVSKYFKVRRTFAYILPTVDSAVEVYNVLTNTTRKQLDTMYITHFQNTDLSAYIIQPSLCIENKKYRDDFLIVGDSFPPEKKSRHMPPIPSFFYDDRIYTKERVLEFYRGGYHQVLLKLKKYYSYKKIEYNVQNLFKHLRIVSASRTPKH